MTQMKHGFGVSRDSMKAEELQRAAIKAKYDTRLQDTDVDITDVTGLTVSVRVVDGKYCMQGKTKEVSYTTLSGALNGIAKAIEAKKAIINKQH